ncbi:MAG: hypothetical protein K0R78_2707, partial [Pelosinus sp.]|nr:hypothetical protein [Pelosinus sp.]
HPPFSLMIDTGVAIFYAHEGISVMLQS